MDVSASSSSKKSANDLPEKKAMDKPYQKYAEENAAAAALKAKLDEMQDSRKTKKAKEAVRKKKEKMTEEQPTETQCSASDCANQITSLDVVPVDHDDTCLSPEELGKLRFTSSIMNTVLDAIEAANQYIERNEDQIIKDFDAIYTAQRSLDKRAAGPRTFAQMMIPDASLAQRFILHAEAMGIIGRYKHQNPEDEIRFESLLAKTSAVENEAFDIYLNQISTPLLAAISMGGNSMVVRFPAISPTKNDFWYLFLSNRAIKYLSTKMTERGFTVQIFKRPNKETTGVDTAWVVTWNRPQDPASQLSESVDVSNDQSNETTGQT